MRRLSAVVGLFALLLFASVASATPAATVVQLSNLHGWIVDTTVLGNPAVPYDFNGPADSSGGTGSFHFGPIGSPNAAKLEMQPPEVNELVSDFGGFQYQFDILAEIASGESAKQLYTNVYVDSAANGVGTLATFYDCRFSFIPQSHVAGWNTFGFDSSTVANDAHAANGTVTCPSTLGGLPAGSTIRFFRLSGGDTTGSDNGLEAAYDRVAVTFAATTTTYDFEPETPCTTVCYVDAANGNNAFGGGSASAAKKTIQAGIDAVSSGGQVRVLPGAYDETATNRGTTTDSGSYQYGLFFPPSKPGITLQGVTAGNLAITNVANVLATVTTNATNDFGYSGVYVSADNITIRGMSLGQNTPYSDAKTIEVIGNNFTLDASAITSDASVYIADGDPRYDNNGTPLVYADDTSYIKTYSVTGNTFAGDSSLYVANGAGFSGPTSGRTITGNSFTNTEPVSFAGPGAEGWLVYPVGAAVFTGNTFTDATATRYVQAWGAQAPAPFDWSDVFTLNTYPHPVVTTTDGNLDHLRPYTACCGSTGGSFTDIYRIGAVIQNRVDNAQVGDTVIAGAGTFAEHVTLSQRITLEGAGVTTIVDPSTDGPAIAITGSGTLAQPLTVEQLETTGATGGGNTGSGIAITATVSHVKITNVASKSNTGHGLAVNTSGAVNDLVLDQVDFSNNTTDGLRIPTSMAGMDGLTISSSHFDNNGFAGIEIYGPPSTGAVTNVSITDSTFSGDTTKGIYAERLDHATLDGITVHASGTTGAFSAGIDLNLKKQAFTNITIENSSITDSGTGDATNGVGITIKSRDDGSNGPTSFAGVVLTKNTITGNQYGLRLGETGKNNVGPTGVQVTRNNISGNVSGHGVINVSQTTDDVSCNWWGSSTGPGGSGPGSGNSVSNLLTFVPWLLSSDLNGDCSAISVGSAAADATGNEGSLISTSGSFAGSIASITADNGGLGTFVDNGDGSWSWSYTPTDNFGPTTINVTGHGTNGSTAVDSFDASAANVNPTATFNHPTTQRYSTGFSISLTSPSDPSSADTTAGFTYAFDCGDGSGYGLMSATSSASCTAPADPGNITVKGKIFDKDGGSTEYTFSLEITQPAISLTPASKNFGSQLVGTTSASSAFTVKNVGTADLDISSVGLAGTNPGHFGIDTNHCDLVVLVPNETCMIDIFFAPTSSGAKSARLEVDSNDPDLPTAVSNLSGTGSVASNGLITINLDARPDGAQSFAFNGTNGIGSFNLVDNGTPSNTASFSAAAGSYVITMTQVNGWSLKSLTCNATETINRSHRKVTINLTSGQNVSCTFTETHRLPDASIALTSAGTYAGVGVYAATAQPTQTQNQAIAIGQTKSFYVHLTNNSLDTDRFNVFSTLTGSTKFAVKFFSGATDVTARVNAGTYNISLTAGQIVTLRIQVKALSGTPATAARNIDLTMKSRSSSSRDVVRGHVTRA